MDRSTPGPNQLLKVAQVHVHCTGDAVQPSHPLTPSSPSALNLSQHQGLFQRVICLHQMTKILEFSFSFSISPSSEYSGFISLKIAWFHLLAVQGTFRSLLQHHSSEAQFFGVLPSSRSSFHNTTGKTIVLTVQTFVPLI